MTHKTSAPLAEREAQATEIAKALMPACARIEIAGSIRRRKSVVGDIEIVCIPRTAPVLDMFGDVAGQTSELDPLLDGLAWPRTKNGERYKQFRVAGVQLDLFICTPTTWAMNLLLRTGSAEFSHKFVTPQRQGGMLPGGFAVKDAQLWRYGKPLLLHEEPEVFEAVGATYFAPWDR